MSQSLTIVDPHTDLALVKLAREVAINHFPIQTILKNHRITIEEWEAIQRNPRFAVLLEGEIAAWNGAMNTHERTKLKAASLVEEFLPEANSRLYDKSENLPAKVELLKLLTRVADMGVTSAQVAGGGERFNVTINLGSDEKIKIQKEIPQVVDVTPGGGSE